MSTTFESCNETVHAPGLRVKEKPKNSMPERQIGEEG